MLSSDRNVEDAQPFYLRTQKFPEWGCSSADWRVSTTYQFSYSVVHEINLLLLTSCHSRQVQLESNTAARRRVTTEIGQLSYRKGSSSGRSLCYYLLFKVWLNAFLCFISPGVESIGDNTPSFFLSYELDWPNSTWCKTSRGRKKVLLTQEIEVFRFRVRLVCDLPAGLRMHVCIRSCYEVLM